MKRIIVLFALLLGSIISIAQPVTQRGTTSVTVQDARLFAQYNFRPPVFPDTTSANTQIGLDSCGALIYSRDINAYYYRACSPKRWVRVSSGGSISDSAYLSYRPLTDSTFLLCRAGGTRCDTIKINGKGVSTAWIIGGNANPSPPNLGTTTTTDLNLITNNVARLKVAGNGINRSSAARNKFLTMDTTTRYLYYTDGGGGGDTIPSLQDVATVGNYYVNDYGDTLKLNSYDGNNKHPLLWVNDQYNTVNILDFSYNTGFNQNVASIKFGDSTNTLATGYIKITDKESYFRNELSERTIIQNTPSISGSNQITYFPLMKGGTDTLATTEDIRNSAIDTSNKWVNNIYRTSGVDSIYYTIGSTTYAIKDSVGNAAGGGGGGGKIYYFNGSVNLGTFGGITMYELGDTAITGTAANFTRSTTGNIANFITDVNKPGLLQIPAGVWTIDAYLSETGGGSNHAQIYALLEKWNGSTITTIATSPVEEITNGSAVDLYTYAISVPTTTLSATDRIIIQFYIQNTNGKTVTLYTQNGYVGEVHTTFTTGIGALNGLTASTQTFATGTSGTDFNISSATSTHTFNLPTASATNRGALSSANWSTFNSKISPSDTATMLSPYLRKIDTTNRFVNNISRTIGKDSIIFYIGSTRYAIKDSSGGQNLQQVTDKGYLTTNPITSQATLNAVNNITGAGTQMNGNIFQNSRNDLTYSYKGIFDTDSLSWRKNGSLYDSRIKLIPNHINGLHEYQILPSASTNTNDTIATLTDIRIASATYLAKSDSATYYTKYRSDTSRTNIYNALNGKQGTLTLTTTGTSGASTLVGNTLNIPQYSGGTSYTFSTGLTNTANTITNNLSTGVAGGQSVVGGTAASENLTLSSTTNATKGKILFGTSAYDEVNNRLGIGLTSPTAQLDVVGTGKISTTDNSYNQQLVIENKSTGTTALTGIVLQYGSSSSLVGQMTYVPSNYVTASLQNTLLFSSAGQQKLAFVANGSGSGGVAQDMYFSTLGTNSTYQMQIKGNTGNVQIGTNTDAGYKLDVNGTARALTYLHSQQIIGYINAAPTATFTYKNTNAGSNNTPQAAFGDFRAGISGLNTFAFRNAEGLVFNTTNASATPISRAAISITNQVNTAGSESGDLIFSTQSGGTAMSEKMRITGAGGLTINATNTAAGTTGNQTINKASGTVNIAAAGTTVTVTNNLVTTSSIVFAVIRTNDATATIKNVVPASGSFTINLNAATTAETSIGFFVIN